MPKKPRPASPLDKSRRALADALPDALERAIDNYRLLAETPAPEDAKAFQQHQAACKAALAHVEALVKLVAAVDTSVRDTAGGADVGGLIARAEEAFRAYAATEDADDDGTSA